MNLPSWIRKVKSVKTGSHAVLQCGDDIAVLELEQDSTYMNLQFQFLVADMDRLPHGMRIGESFGGSVGNCCGKAWVR